MKLRIILSGTDGGALAYSREVDRQTIECDGPEYATQFVCEALKAWTLATGDTIKIMEVE